MLFRSYPEYFDWENINYVTLANGMGNVGLPWSTGTNTAIHSEWLHNHPKSDGWELLYSTLCAPVQNIPIMFSLYNKYSGRMRLFYLYMGTTESSNSFFSALQVRRTTGNKKTTLLNFEGKVNRNHNQLEDFPVSIKGPEVNIAGSNIFVLTTGFVQGTWYGFEYEFSYQNISGQSQDDYSLYFFPFRVTKSSITLQGSINGSITGTMESRSNTSSLINNLNLASIFSNTNNTSVRVNTGNIVNSIVQNVEAAKTKATPKFWQGLWAKIKKDIPTAVQTSLTTTLTTAVNQGIKWATNPLSAFVSSVFSVGQSGSATPINKVDLKINANISMSGTINTELPLPPFNLALPTTVPSSAGGWGYPTQVMNGWGLGVWNVQNLPKVRYDIKNIIFVIDGNAVAHPQESNVFITLPNFSQAWINVNSKVTNDCIVLQRKVEYIIKTGCSTTQAKLDNWGLSPFNFSSPAPGVRIQSYQLPTMGVAYSLPYYSFQDANTTVYARATLVLQNTSTGKEFVHIKDFPLEYESYSQWIYRYDDGPTIPELPE